MFENDIFEVWLDKKANEIIVELGNGKSLSTEEMMILVLKAQTNHFAHLDIELRDNMKELREDLTNDMKELREDMDKRFEQVDKRFEQLISRMDRFMIWSLGITVSSTIFILAYLHKILG